MMTSESPFLVKYISEPDKVVLTHSSACQQEVEQLSINL